MDKSPLESPSDVAETGSARKAAPGSGRVVSIDALRGFDMFWIIGGRGVFLAVVGLFVSDIPQ